MEARDSLALAHLPRHVPTAARILLVDFLAKAAESLGDSLHGIVLFGSLAAGGFDLGTSDIDLIVAVSTDLSDEAVDSLRRMHEELELAHPEWEDRVDVVYVSARGLQTFKQHTSPLVVISRGEPIHRTRTDEGWVMNWHAARESGVSLFGPPPRELIGTTTRADFASAIRSYMPWLLEKLTSSNGPELQIYAILTACRALYACTTGEQASKEAAASWAEDRYPEWSEPIRAARERRIAAAARRPGAREPIGSALEFVRFVAEHVSRGGEG